MPTPSPASCRSRAPRSSRRWSTDSAPGSWRRTARSTVRRWPTSCSTIPRRWPTSTTSCTPRSGPRSPAASSSELETDHVVVLDVPLLVESGRDDLVGLIVVDTDPEVAVRTARRPARVPRGRRAGAHRASGVARGPTGPRRLRDQQRRRPATSSNDASTSAGSGSTACRRSTEIA